MPHRHPHPKIPSLCSATQSRSCRGTHLDFLIQFLGYTGLDGQLLLELCMPGQGRVRWRGFRELQEAHAHAWYPSLTWAITQAYDTLCMRGAHSDCCAHTRPYAVPAACQLLSYHGLLSSSSASGSCWGCTVHKPRSFVPPLGTTHLLHLSLQITGILQTLHCPADQDLV